MNTLQILSVASLCINIGVSFWLIRERNEVYKARKRVTESLDNLDKLHNDVDRTLTGSQEHLDGIVKLLGEMVGIHDMVIKSNIDKSVILDSIIERLILAKNVECVNKSKIKLS